MSVLYTNNASTTLATGITSSSTSISVSSGKGSLFPAISGSDFFYVTLTNTAGTVEIVKVTARSTDTLTVVRGQDGTTAAAWNAGDKVELRVTKGLLDQLKIDAVNGYASDSSLSSHTGNTSNPHSVTATQVGLGNVDNTSDVNKPVSTAQAASIATKVTANSAITAGTGTKITYDTKGLVTSSTTLSASDIPSLDASKITSGTIDSARLPSYVDDVIEGASLASFPTTGETGKIYVALDTNKTYRWSGSAYVYITSGAVDSVAGKTGVVTLVKGDVGLGSVDNTSDLSKPVSTATQTALNLKADSSTLSSHTGNTSNPHSVTKAQVGLTNVEDKSSATIRSEITSSNVTTALGYTPYNSTNPSGYTSNTGTVTSVSGTGSYGGLTLSGSVTTSGSLTLGGTPTGTWPISVTGSSASCTGNAATVSSITGNTGLMINRLAAPAFIDGLTTSNFRTTFFGTTTYSEALVTSRWNTTPTPLAGLGPYGTAVAWAASDTHGFLAIDYGTANAKIGGGNGNAINWTAMLIHSGNIGSQSVNYASSAGSVAASGITGQTGMWTSAARPGAYRLYRNDDNSAYNIQTSWSSDRSGYWSIRGYYNDTYHAACYVAYAGYADSAGNGGVTSVNGMTGAVTLSTGGVTSLNGQTGAIVNTNLYAIGSYVIGRPQNETHYAVNSTVAGSSLYATPPNGVCRRIDVYDDDGYGAFLYSYYEWKIAGTAWPAGETLVNIGSWRCVSPATQTYSYGYAGLWVRYA